MEAQYASFMCKRCGTGFVSGQLKAGQRAEKVKGGMTVTVFFKGFCPKCNAMCYSNIKRGISFKEEDEYTESYTKG